MPFRPVLGAAVHNYSEVKLPCFASYKLDGIRAIWQGVEFFSRTMKTLPNRELQSIARQLEIPPGYDGELIVGEPNAPDVFRSTETYIMSRGKSLAGVSIGYYVFDNFMAQGGFADRQRTLRDISPLVIRLDQTLIENYDALAAFEDKAVGLGFEGVICRSPTGRYKQGRSTVREQILIKLKRFTDDEAIVIGFEELQHNANTPLLDERGYTRRSHHQAGKFGGGMLGALVVNWRGHTLRIGTGFSRADRENIWAKQVEYFGAPVTFKYLPVGVKDLPRHPVFLRFRPRGT